MKRKLQNFSLHQVYILGNFILIVHETILMALSRRVDGAIKHRIKLKPIVLHAKTYCFEVKNRHFTISNK